MIQMMVPRIVALLRAKRHGLSFQKISVELGLLPKEKTILKKRLADLEKRGIILKLRKKYFIRPQSRFIQGKLVTTQRGFGFVRPKEKLLEDVFIPARYAGGALLGDEVEVLYKDKGRKGKPEGRVVRILHKEKKSILGFYKENRGQSFILPFDSPSEEEVPLKSSIGFSPKSGMVVETERDSNKLKRVLGWPDDPGVDTYVVVQRFDLRPSFSKAALAEAEGCNLAITARDRKARVDYRNWATVTIDGEKAQDFDDAVSIKKLENGRYLLGVHISDVSHYVKPNTPLDKEAYLRGTSVYFPDTTLPMLPDRLSNNICSLRPKEDKLTLTVLFQIDKEGLIEKTDFHSSLIKTVERMTYDSVFKILKGDKEERRKYADLVPDFLRMEELARILRMTRVREGSLDFDLVEPELIYKDERLFSVVSAERNVAHQIIEEFMLAANEAVASFLIKEDVPMIYRIHPSPSVESLARLREMLESFGITLPLPKKIKSRDLQLALVQAEERAEEKFINLQILKSLKLAHYADENEGHFGLAKKEYTHFTSPIRRYPDLCIHRILKKVLDNDKAELSSFSSVASHCSVQERQADEAERELLEWRIFRLLKSKLGEEVQGIIVGFSKAGLIVELDNYFVDGLIPFSDLKGDYYFRKAENALIRRSSGSILKLGDRVQVILASVDPFLRRMGLALPLG